MIKILRAWQACYWTAIQHFKGPPPHRCREWVWVKVEDERSRFWSETCSCHKHTVCTFTYRRLISKHRVGCDGVSVASLVPTMHLNMSHRSCQSLHVCDGSPACVSDTWSPIPPSVCTNRRLAGGFSSSQAATQLNPTTKSKQEGVHLCGPPQPTAANNGLLRGLAQLRPTVSSTRQSADGASVSWF